MYLYQAAVVSALKAEDTDEVNRTWVLANMCRDWAIFQANANQPLWAITNSSFAVKLCRDLVATNKEKYLPSLAMCLNNLGSHQFKLQYYAEAAPAFEEALTIRRSLPAEAEDNVVAVYNSLANLALLKIELGKRALAGELLDEALALCEKIVQRNPGRMADLTRLQSWNDQLQRK
jgi:tetratricopeptide (TPR) repeat protein